VSRALARGVFARAIGAGDITEADVRQAVAEGGIILRKFELGAGGG